jgi:hypothetical protein
MLVSSPGMVSSVVSGKRRAISLANSARMASRALAGKALKAAVS